MTEAGGLAGKRVVLGVCGGVAAYKAIEVCRRLGDSGALVSPVLTPLATRFVTALTFSAVADEPARTSMFGGPEPSPHTTLGQRADLVVVSPITARTIAAYTAGLADDLLVAVLLMARCPVLVCPAMHTEMWEHPSTRENLATLRRRGVHVLDPATGHLAGGDTGAGRLPEPDEIVAECERLVVATADATTVHTSRRPSMLTRALDPGAGSGPAAVASDLRGRRVVVTSGGTREAIDPVRFIGNRSSGKQGYAVAAEAAARGAIVTLVTTVERTTADGVEVVLVESAAEMEVAVAAAAADADVVIMAAAVADFRPEVVASLKLKKAGGVPEVRLEPTPDILAGLGQTKTPGQVLVGFAAETEDLMANATAKLARKRVDLMVANDVSQDGAGFGHDTNKVILLGSDGTVVSLPMTSKAEVARAVLDAVVARLAPPDIDERG